MWLFEVLFKGVVKLLVREFLEMRWGCAFVALAVLLHKEIEVSPEVVHGYVSRTGFVKVLFVGKVATVG